MAIGIVNRRMCLQEEQSVVGRNDRSIRQIWLTMKGAAVTTFGKISAVKVASRTGISNVVLYSVVLDRQIPEYPFSRRLFR